MNPALVPLSLASHPGSITNTPYNSSITTEKVLRFIISEAFEILENIPLLKFIPTNVKFKLKEQFVDSSEEESKLLPNPTTD